MQLVLWEAGELPALLFWMKYRDHHHRSLTHSTWCLSLSLPLKFSSLQLPMTIRNNAHRMYGANGIPFFTFHPRGTMTTSYVKSSYLLRYSWLYEWATWCMIALLSWNFTSNITNLFKGFLLQRHWNFTQLFLLIHAYMKQITANLSSYHLGWSFSLFVSLSLSTLRSS